MPCGPSSVALRLLLPPWRWHAPVKSIIKNKDLICAVQCMAEVNWPQMPKLKDGWVGCCGSTKQPAPTLNTVRPATL